LYRKKQRFLSSAWVKYPYLPTPFAAKTDREKDGWQSETGTETGYGTIDRSLISVVTALAITTVIRRIVSLAAFFLNRKLEKNPLPMLIKPIVAAPLGNEIHIHTVSESRLEMILATDVVVVPFLGLR